MFDDKVKLTQEFRPAGVTWLKKLTGTKELEVIMIRLNVDYVRTMNKKTPNIILWV